MGHNNEIPKGAFCDARPGETVPDHYISIPMYRSVKQMKAFADQLTAQRAKDITPKGEGET